MFFASYVFAEEGHGQHEHEGPIIRNEQMAPHKEKGTESEHEGHQHMMGEKDPHMMTGSGIGESMQSFVKEISPAAPVKEFNLEAYQFSYSPETIVVNKGDVVKIHAISRDVPHGFFIKEYGINEKVEKGKVKDIEFVADEAGEFEIICSVYCGRKHHSMKAKLIVQE